MTLTEGEKRVKRIKKSLFSLGMAEKVASIVILIVAWQLVSNSGIGGFKHMPSPVDVFSVAVVYIPSIEFVEHLLTSMLRIAAGFIIACITGIPLGLFMGWKLAFRNWAFPTFEILRPIPPLAWIPLAVVMFNTIEASIIFIIWTGAFFPIVLNTILGVTMVPENIKKATISLGANPKEVFRHIIIPAAMPSILTGMALGMGITWDQLVAAEMLAGGSGVGYQLWYFYIIENFPKVVMFMIVVGAVGYLFSTIIRTFGNRYMKWRSQF